LRRKREATCTVPRERLVDRQADATRIVPDEAADEDVGGQLVEATFLEAFERAELDARDASDVLARHAARQSSGGQPRSERRAALASSGIRDRRGRSRHREIVVGCHV
jgi:hypothetical protein